MVERDIIVIGGSAGCLPAVRTLIACFPKDFPVSVFAVVHTHSRAPSMLAKIISSVGVLPAVVPIEGDKIERGHIYIAPTDHHLIVAKEHVHVSHGPKEGLHRPSINATFRSAANAYRERVIGILLSGMLDDGAAGLWEIARKSQSNDCSGPRRSSIRFHAIECTHGRTHELQAASRRDCFPSPEHSRGA